MLYKLLNKVNKTIVSFLLGALLTGGLVFSQPAPMPFIEGIATDGTSTTTASIPFAQGLSIADSTKIFIGGTNASNAGLSIGNTAASIVTFQGYAKIGDPTGTGIDIQIFGGNGGGPDAPGGIVRLAGGAYGVGGNSMQNGFVTTDTAVVAFTLGSNIGGVSSIGNTIEDFYVGGNSYFVGQLSTGSGIGTNGAILTSSSYALLAEGSANRIIGVDRAGSGSAGKTATFQGGWAASGSTNQNAGNAIAAPGKSTGTGVGGVEIQAVGGGSSGTADQTPTTVATFAKTTLTFVDGFNLVFNASTGSMIGTSNLQKFSFHGATPTAQQGNTTDLGVVLSNKGLRVAGTAYPITTSGTIAFSGTFGSSGVSSFTNATDSSSTSTGGAIFSGGIGIAKSLYSNNSFSSTKAISAGNSTGYIAKVGGVIFNDFADATVGGAEADIYTYTIPANTLNTNGHKIIASYSGNFVTVGTELTQLKVYLAGTAIWDSTGVAPTTGTTSWNIKVELIRKSSSVVIYSVSLTTTGASGYVYQTTGELTGLTLSGTNILKITGTSSGVGSGAGDIVGKMSYGEWKPAA